MYEPVSTSFESMRFPAKKSKFTPSILLSFVIIYTYLILYKYPSTILKVFPFSYRILGILSVEFSNSTEHKLKTLPLNRNSSRHGGNLYVTVVKFLIDIL